MAQHAELEVALRRRDEHGYPVEMRYLAIDSDTDEHIPAKGTAYAAIDPQKLDGLESVEYGQTLGKWLFANPEILVAFEKARDSLQAVKTGDAALRVRLYIDPGAEELHRLHWEKLCDIKGVPLFNGTEVLFSRYLATSNWHAPRGMKALKALIVIADPRYANPFDPGQFDPDNFDQNPKLAPVKVPEERQRAEAGFQKTGIAFQTLATGEADSLGKATLENILEQLDRDFDILYLVCHGALMRDDRVPAGVARLCLEDELIDASRLVERIRAKKHLRLVILASCESAGAASGTLSALGPMLVDAGVPAVIAMQGKVKMTTAAKFMPAFLKALSKEGGQIDRAMGVARDAAVLAECDDYWMPVLFMRLRTGRLWYVPGLAGGAGKADAEIWESISIAMEAQQCTPILGPGVLDSLIGSTRELAKELAANRFPFSPVFSEELPTVAQYMAVRLKKPLFAKIELAKLIARKLPRQAGLDPEKPENLSRILSAAGKTERAANPLDPHRALASKPFSIYVTMNPDNLMEDALREVGRTPRSDFSRWNKDAFFGLTDHSKYPTIREREKNYVPSVENPLVYHLFGQLDLPQPDPPVVDTPKFATRVEAGLGSIALTEDDFFNYLLSIGSKADAKDDVPGPVGTALTANALLFLGFRQDDWSFRVLLRSIFNKEGSNARMVGENANPCVGAQIQPEEDRVSQPSSASRYFEQYLRKSEIDIFWGSTVEFVEAFQENTTRVVWKQTA